MSSLDTYHKDFDEFARDVDDEEKSWNTKVRYSIMFWLVRWTVAFIFVGIIYSYRPDWMWLWWTAIPLAAVSLLITLMANVMMRRRFRDTRNKLAQASAFLEALEKAKE
jgi:hypothetical protein